MKKLLLLSLLFSVSVQAKTLNIAKDPYVGAIVVDADSGDVLFAGSVGRTDLPGGDSDELYYSLTQRLAVVPDDTVLYPGHLYSAEPHATMGETRTRNYVYRLPTLEQWRTMFGG